MEELDKEGELIILGNRLYRKVRPKAGRIRNNLWDDINEAKGKERSGYPTQKPLALYERIIKASSKEGDIVLDPFCGCATTPIAAERLGRKLIGMDIWDGAHQQVLNRLEQQGLAVPKIGGGEGTSVLHKAFLAGWLHLGMSITPKRRLNAPTQASLLYWHYKRQQEAGVIPRLEHSNLNY